MVLCKNLITILPLWEDFYLSGSLYSFCPLTFVPPFPSHPHLSSCSFLSPLCMSLYLCSMFSPLLLHIVPASSAPTVYSFLLYSSFLCHYFLSCVFSLWSSPPLMTFPAITFLEVKKDKFKTFTRLKKTL